MKLNPQPTTLVADDGLYDCGSNWHPAPDSTGSEKVRIGTLIALTYYFTRISQNGRAYLPTMAWKLCQLSIVALLPLLPKKAAFQPAFQLGKFRLARRPLERKIGCARHAEQRVQDVVVIGSGFGGLCAAALLANYGKKVAVFESHDQIGGCAHAFERQGYTLDSGPSLWSGCATPSTNPLRQVLDAVGASNKVNWVSYDGWGCHDISSGKKWRMTVGTDAFEDVIAQYGATAELGAWRRFLQAIDPVIDASMACPPVALRADAFGFVRTALLPFLFGAVVSGSLRCGRFVPDLLTGPASLLFDICHGDQKIWHNPDSFVRRWVDYLSFAISALPSDGTVGAALSYSIGDLYHTSAFLEYPLGGSGAVADALRQTICERPGCEVRTRAHVEEVVVDDRGERAVAVRLRNGTVVRAKHVISNADAWTTAQLLPVDAIAPAVARWRQNQLDDCRITPSFVHLWVGFDSDGIPEDLDCHHSVFNEGFLGSTPIDAPKNMHIISIPSLFDRSLAPPGKHVAHVYAAANEPFADWEDLPAEKYKVKKERAAQPLWVALEQVIPDIRSRAECVIVGASKLHQ